MFGEGLCAVLDFKDPNDDVAGVLLGIAFYTLGIATTFPNVMPLGTDVLRTKVSS